MKLASKTHQRFTERSKNLKACRLVITESLYFNEFDIILTENHMAIN